MTTSMKLIEACVESIKNRRTFKAAYEKTFELIDANTEELRDKTFRLRHKVYCAEHAFEEACEVDGYTEHDQYDERARHFILKHRVSGEIAGTIRVILPNDEKPGESFPSQEICDHPLLGYDSRMLRMCEISRFCTAPRFRKRDGDGRFLSSYHNQDVIEARQANGSVKTIRRTISYMPAALLAGAFEAAIEARILDCIWMVESCHLESLRDIGFLYRTLGPQIDFHGGAQPIVFNIKHVLDNMRRDAPNCWDIVSDGGRLQELADDLAQDLWQDMLMDEKCQEKIYKKLTKEAAK